MKKSIKNHFLSIILLFIFVCTYFYEQLFLHYIFVVGDNFSVNIPFNVFLLDSLKQGVFPLWNPYILGGVPFIVGSNIHAFPTLILFLVLPPHLAMTYSIIIITFLAGIFMYFFTFSLNKNKLASLFTAIVYMFSGLFAKSHASSVATLSLMYLPLIMLLFFSLLRTKNWVFALLCGFVMFLFYLGGHPVYLLVTLLFTVSFVLINSTILLSVRLTMIVLSLITFFVLSFPFLKFQLEFTHLSSRPINSTDYSSSFLIEYNDLLTFIFPHLYGIPEIELTGNIGSFLYIGFLPLLLSLYGSTSLYTKTRFFTLTAVLGLILSFGKNTPLYSVLLLLPSVSFFRQPAYFYLVTLFSLSILSGYGLNLFSQNIVLFQNFVIKYFTFIKRVLVTLLCILLIGATLILDAKDYKWWENIITILYPFINHRELPILLSKTPKIKFIILYNLSTASLFLTILTVYLGMVRKINSKAILISSLILITFLELFFLNKAEFISVPKSDYEKAVTKEVLPSYLFDPQIKIATYQSYKAPNFYTFKREDYVLDKISVNNTLLGPNRNMINKVYSIMGFNPLLPENTVTHFTVDNSTHIVGLTGDDIKLDHSLLKDSGVHYILSNYPINDNFLTLMPYKRNGVYIYKVEHAKPRFYLTDGVNQYCCVTIRKDTPNEIVLDVSLIKNLDLIILDTYYPGWKASIDNNSTPITLFNNVFKRIEIPKGNHQISLLFSPFTH